MNIRKNLKPKEKPRLFSGVFVEILTISKRSILEILTAK